MKKISTAIPAVALIVTMFLCVCMIYSSSCASKKQPDPLLEYVYADKIVSPKQHDELVDHMSHEQRVLLWKALKGDKAEVPAELTSKELDKELLWESSHWITYPFKDFDYTDIVRACATDLDYPSKDAKYSTTFELEHYVCEKTFETMWDQLTVEQREQILKESGVSGSEIAGYACLGGAAMLAATATSASLMGFGFYILTAKTIVVAAGAIFGATAATTTTVVSALVGPIGWGIAAASAAAGLFLIGGKNEATTVAYIVQLHYFKVQAMSNSEIDVKRYLPVDQVAKE